MIEPLTTDDCVNARRQSRGLVDFGDGWGRERIVEYGGKPVPDADHLTAMVQ
jgi:hypothetical protein